LTVAARRAVSKRFESSSPDRHSAPDGRRFQARRDRSESLRLRQSGPGVQAYVAPPGRIARIAQVAAARIRIPDITGGASWGRPQCIRDAKQPEVLKCAHRGHRPPLRPACQAHARTISPPWVFDTASRSSRRPASPRMPRANADSDYPAIITFPDAVAPRAARDRAPPPSASSSARYDGSIALSTASTPSWSLNRRASQVST
jgi:hypothetical protein